MPAAALVTGLILAAQSHNPGPAGSAPAKPAVATAAYVTRQVEAALANADHYIVRDTTNSYAGGTYTSWTDPRTGSSYARQGTGSRTVLSWNSSYFVHRVLHWRTTEADYSTHTWFVSVIHAAGPVQGRPTTPADGGVLGPAQLEKWLKDGTMRVVGHGQVNGHQATALRARMGIITMEFWVDSRTFQPVRMIRSFGGGLQARLVSNESWIARTPGLVSLANHARVPAGFTRVAAPR